MQEFNITEYPIVKFFGMDKTEPPQRFRRIEGTDAFLVEYATAQWEAQTPPPPVRGFRAQGLGFGSQGFSRIVGSEGLLVQHATAQWEAQTPPPPVRGFRAQGRVQGYQTKGLGV